MSDFKHSAVLFSGDDGLPLEFNIRNANEKQLLKALIEHGGGLCSQSESAIHLVSSNVLNADLGKMLVSTQYVFDCVKENNLLEVDKYVFVVKETQISDISDDDSGDVLMKPNKSAVSDNPVVKNRSPLKVTDKIFSKSSKNTKSSPQTSADVFASSNQTNSSVEESMDAASHAKLRESVFQDMVAKSPRIKFAEINPTDSSELSEHICASQQWASTAKDDCLTAKSTFSAMAKGFSPIIDSLSLISPTKSQGQYSNFIQSQDLLQNQGLFPLDGKANNSVVSTIVTSSQPERSELDNFDNILLEKAQNKQDDEDLSQSYTVSSSADALAASKPNSAEMFDRENALPDSPEERESPNDEYLKKLEEEVEQILMKPSPKSIQDKILLVKYVCFAKKLTPAIVLQSLNYL